MVRLQPLEHDPGHTFLPSQILTSVTAALTPSLQFRVRCHGQRPPTNADERQHQRSKSNAKSRRPPPTTDVLCGALDPQLLTPTTEHRTPLADTKHQTPNTRCPTCKPNPQSPTPHSWRNQARETPNTPKHQTTKTPATKSLQRQTPRSQIVTAKPTQTPNTEPHAGYPSN